MPGKRIAAIYVWRQLDGQDAPRGEPVGLGVVFTDHWPARTDWPVQLSSEQFYQLSRAVLEAVRKGQGQVEPDCSPGFIGWGWKPSSPQNKGR